MPIPVIDTLRNDYSLPVNPTTVGPTKNIHMKNKLTILSFIFISFCHLGCNNTDDDTGFDQQAMFAQLTNNVILPHLQAYQATLNTLQATTEAFINQPEINSLNTLQEAWINTQMVWKNCVGYNFGPTKEEFLFNKIDKWPANVGLIEGLIIVQDVIDERLIDNAGSTSKGLPAIEYLIFRADEDQQAIIDLYTTDENKENRKAYLNALVENLINKSNRLVEIWSTSGDNYQATFSGQDGSDTQTSLSLIVNRIVESLELIIVRKIAKPQGRETGIPNLDLIESLYANKSLEHIQNEITALQQIFNGGLNEYLDFLTEGDNENLSRDIDQKFTNISNALAAINPPLTDAIINDEEKINVAYDQLADLRTLFRTDVSSHFSILIGIFDTDGD